MKNSSICINLIGILYEKRQDHFNLIHSDLYFTFLVALENSINQFIHLRNRRCN